MLLLEVGRRHTFLKPVELECSEYVSTWSTRISTTALATESAPKVYTCCVFVFNDVHVTENNDLPALQGQCCSPISFYSASVIRGRGGSLLHYDLSALVFIFILFNLFSQLN